MLRRKLGESLTARIFVITFLILLGAGAGIFGLMAWATPMTYTAVVNDDLQRRVDSLVEKLSNTDLNDCGPVLDAFIRSAGADAFLVGPDEAIANVGSKLAIQTVYESDASEVSFSGHSASDASVNADEISSETAFDSGASASSSEISSDSAGEASSGTASGETSAADDLEHNQTLSWEPAGTGNEDVLTITTAKQSTIAADITFADQEESYTLYVTPHIKAENLAVRALKKMAPWLLLVLLALSWLCAWAYSRYITRPIVRLSEIAGRMAGLDFDWKCGEKRRDEIGALGRSLDQMAQRLSAALSELETTNRALRGEVEQERELDRQRMAFFSAASHELKTPVTILKGQLAGMLEGIGVYRDREKYLLRSLKVTGRMENLIREMLVISRIEAGLSSVRQESVDLSGLIERQLSLDGELFAQRGQRLEPLLTPGLFVTGDPSLLGKAIGNLLSNAAHYSPESAKIRVWCGMEQGSPVLRIENTGAHIRDDALPHLFEPFYREDSSRSRATGGSGLGLYLVRMILERHHAICAIENTENGVRAEIHFAAR